MQLSKKSTAVLAIAIAWIFYLYTYTARIEPSVLVNELMSEFHITSAVIGSLISIAYIPYVVMQIPCGIITDKLGVKTILVLSSIFCALGAFIFASAHSVLQLNIGRFLIGLAGAPAFLCCGKVASEFFDKRKFAMLMGLAMAMGCAGGMVGTAPTAYMVSKIGWRGATYIIAAIGVVVAVLAFFILKKPTKKNEISKENLEKEKSNLLHGLKVLIKDRKIWLLGFYGAMTYLALSGIAEIWGVPFMAERYGVSTQKAAISSVAILVGFAIGGIISAWISVKINSYKKTIIIFTAAAVASFSVAFYSDGIGFNACIAMLFLGGVFCGANTLCFTLAYSLVPKEFGGTSSGFMNTLIMLSATFFPPILGKLLDFFRNGKVNESGMPVYDIVTFRSAFMFFIAALVLATIATLFIKDLKHKEEA